MEDLVTRGRIWVGLKHPNQLMKTVLRRCAWGMKAHLYLYSALIRVILRVLYLKHFWGGLNPEKKLIGKK
jgi:hypothetical protein